MAGHKKGARGSTWDKHTNRDKGKSQKKQQNPNWIDQGKNNNSPRNKARSENKSGGGIIGGILNSIFGK